MKKLKKFNIQLSLNKKQKENIEYNKMRLNVNLLMIEKMDQLNVYDNIKCQKGIN